MSKGSSGVDVDERVLGSAGQLIAAVRRGTLRSRDLLEAYLNRVDRFNGSINAVVTIDADGARRQADAADRLITNGCRVGRLHGLPMTVKDTYETAGMRTTAGAPALADHVPATDAEAVARLRRAGAVVFGKTNTATYAADAQTHNPIFGVTANPWDVHRSPGGSSGGSAAAVAAGLSALELGSELSGSARLPAHYCGVYALRPSEGLIPATGNIPRPPGSLTSNDMVTPAPITRTAGDLELALDVLAGPSSGHARAWRLDLPEPRVRRLSDYRIGIWLDDPACPVDADVGEVLWQAVDALYEAGARIQTVHPVDLAAHNELYDRLLYGAISSGLPADVFSQHCEVAGRLDVHELSARARLVRGVTQRHREWLDANERRAQVRAGWARFFTDVDVLICPVSPVAAIPHDHRPDPLQRTVVVNDRPRPYWDQIGWTCLATAGGLPSASVPAGFTRSGLPVGLQVIGGFLNDRTVCRMAVQLESLIGGYSPPPMVMQQPVVTVAA